MTAAATGPATSTDVGGAAHPVDALSDAYVVAAAAADPCLATFVGIAGYDDVLPDYGPAGHERRAALVRATLARLDRIAPPGAGIAGAEGVPLDDRHRVAAAQLGERLTVELARHDAGIVAAELRTYASPVQLVRQVLDLMPRETDADWEAIAARMAAVPTALDGYRESLRDSARAGRVAARRQVLSTAAQARGFAGGTGAPSFFGLLVEGSGASGGLLARLDAGAARANQAYSGLAAFLLDELLADAPDSDAVGADVYALESRYHLGAELDLTETYAWGWAELDRIETELAAVARQIVPGGGLPEAIAALDADPMGRLEGPAELRRWLQDTSDAALAALSGVHFDVPDPVRRLECLIAPTPGGGMYYTGPSEDFDRPGRMWWAIPTGVTGFAGWRERTTVYHEGIPGHHLQIAQTVFRADRLNRFQRLLCWVPGHGEGWALYAERLMAELGFLDEPADRLGMLDAQALRAARVVLDIGLHLELELPAAAGMYAGQRWTAEIGREFLAAHTRLATPMVHDEIDRYLGWPGQAPAYKVGERVWLECRADARRRHGDAFDLRAFHAAALDLGSMGLGPLRAELARL